jgi:hypothetical protein
MDKIANGRPDMNKFEILEPAGSGHGDGAQGGDQDKARQ